MARPQHGAPLAAALGLYRVADPAERLAGVLPQAAWRLDPAPRTGQDEVRIRVDRLNLDAASFRQLSEANDGDGDAIREAVREIIASRGKMHNPVTGSGGMLTGIVEDVGPDSQLGLKPGDRVATLVSLTLTPVEIYDNLVRWDGLSEQIPCDGHAILFGRSIAAVLPADLPVPLALSVLDACGAPALTRRVVQARGGGGGRGEDFSRQSFRTPREISPAAPSADNGHGPVVAILGAAGKGGSLSAAAARQAGGRWIIGVVATEEEADLLHQANELALGQPGHPANSASPAPEPSAASPAPELSSAPPTSLAPPTPFAPPILLTAPVIAAHEAPAAPPAQDAAAPHDAHSSSDVCSAPPSPLVDEVVIADAREPVLLAEAVARAGGPADVTVVCVDAAGCEGAAILSTAHGGTVIFFSMATSFSAAALGAQGVAADVTMLIGNGYVPGHADYALDLIRTSEAVRALFDYRLAERDPRGSFQPTFGAMVGGKLTQGPCATASPSQEKRDADAES